MTRIKKPFLYFAVRDVDIRDLTTATARTTPSKKCVVSLIWNFAFNEIYLVCLLVLKHASAEYITNAFSSKEKYEKLAIVVHVLQTMLNLVISRCCFAGGGKEMYKEL